MKTAIRLCLLAGCLALLPGPALAEWQAVETVDAYSISGKTGVALYQSIGERGPKVGGKVSAIAHTNFKLTWSRKYEVQDGACVLVSARPKLVITYTLPRPAEPLPTRLPGAGRRSSTASASMNWCTAIPSRTW